MTCRSPRDAWFSQAKTAAGKRRVQFTPNGAFGDVFKIACQRCDMCRIDKAAAVGARVDLEMQTALSSGFDGAIFLTLTYDDEHLPPGGSLRPVDVQLFMKRLREHLARRFNRKRIRFFLAGEYGERLARPHYHAIIVGHDFREDRRKWSKPGADQLYRSESLEKLWPFGTALFGDAGPGSGKYVAQYSLKKVYGKEAPGWYQGREPEFMRSSQGLGRDAFELDMASNLAMDGVVTSDGKINPIPRGLERYIPPEDLERIKAARVERSRDLVRRRNRTPARLQVRAEVKLARMRLYRPDRF